MICCKQKKPRLTEHSERKSEAEFDPPPLLETTVELKVVDLKGKDECFMQRQPFATKSGGGFNSRSDLCSSFDKLRMNPER